MLRLARFGRFAADPSPLELERFFRLDADGLRLVGGKRRDENRLGLALQWGTVRMLGTFLSEDPTCGSGRRCSFRCRAAGDRGAAVPAGVRRRRRRMSIGGRSAGRPIPASSMRAYASSVAAPAVAVAELALQLERGGELGPRLLIVALSRWPAAPLLIAPPRSWSASHRGRGRLNTRLSALCLCCSRVGRPTGLYARAVEFTGLSGGGGPARRR